MSRTLVGLAALVVVLAAAPDSGEGWTSEAFDGWLKPEGQAQRHAREAGRHRSG